MKLGRNRVLPFVYALWLRGTIAFRSLGHYGTKDGLQIIDCDSDLWSIWTCKMLSVKSLSIVFDYIPTFDVTADILSRSTSILLYLFIEFNLIGLKLAAIIPDESNFVQNTPTQKKDKYMQLNDNINAEK